MSGKVTMVEEMDLSGTDNGKITVTTVEAPYGQGSASVASIGISLQGNVEDPDWKVHLPKENIDGVITALQKAKESL
ncbi:MAG: hypothetical protein ABXS91_00395 [Sulfurimonas sp.]